MPRSIFVSLPIENLSKSLDFFGKLGFTFNEQYSDEATACMVVSESIFFMLEEKSKFEGFIDKSIAPKTYAEAVFSLSCEEKSEVSKTVELAAALGARPVGEPEDLGFMFSWGFEDLDGHLWNLIWMNSEQS